MRASSFFVSLLALAISAEAYASPHARLVPRKGGGGGGGGGRGGVSSSFSSGGGSGSGSGSRSGGSSSSSGGGGASSGSAGRTTSSTSSSPKSFGGGQYYGGGAMTPYRSGGRSPGGISPALIVAPALLFGGLWAYGAYSYPYHDNYSFRNMSNPNKNGTNTTLPVDCLCAQYQACGCDQSTNRANLDSIVGNGTIADPSLARVRDVSGKQTLVLNGTLANGTEAATSGAVPSARLSVSAQSASGLLLLAGLAYTVLL